MIDRTRGIAVLAAAASMMTAGLLNADEEHHWSYQGSTGPAKWATLEHAKSCAPFARSFYVREAKTRYGSERCVSKPRPSPDVEANRVCATG